MTRREEVEYLEALYGRHEATKRPLADLAAYSNDALRIRDLEGRLQSAQQRAQECADMAHHAATQAKVDRLRFRRLLLVASAWLTAETLVILWLVAR